MTYTYFFRRLLKNPAYYNLESNEPGVIKKYLINLVDSSIKRLSDHKCVKVKDEDGFKVSFFFIKIFFLCKYVIIK